MTLGTNEGFEEQDVGGWQIRVRIKRMQRLDFASDVGEPVLEAGTPVSLVRLTGQMVPWSTGQGIYGFVVGQDVELSATEAVEGWVMEAGSIHYDDIKLPAGQLQANLDAALLAGPREMGLDITGLPGAGNHLTDPDVS